MNKIVPLSELDTRMKRFREIMEAADQNWQAVVIFSKVNQYYFTGTRQDGMLIIPRDGEAIYWVRRSYDRAMDESQFRDIRPMRSYRDAAAVYVDFPKEVYMETEIVPVAHAQRFQKYFPCERILPVGAHISKLRSIKSEYELDLMRKSGEIHRFVMEERVPRLLIEGINEAEFMVELYAELIKAGHHGVTRFSMFDTEMLFGQIGFGVNSLYPTYFNGPGGSVGLNSAVPVLGNRERKLQKGDLVFVDVGCGCEGYHTDKTMIYMFGREFPEYAERSHKRCVEIQDLVAQMLKPGETPENIYKAIMESVDDDFAVNFMGYGGNKVKFLGHGIGLETDELPVIAKGFKEPICEGMVFAIEPKKGIDGFGLVGVENTFVVTKDGGVSITGSHNGPIIVE